MTATLTEPPGWGAPGSIRHAEQIGHTVWMQDHPDPPEVDHDPVRSAALDAALDEAFKPERCAVTPCARPVHPLWEMHEDVAGNGWFPGEAPR